MSIPDVILFLTLAFASSFLQRVTGFGFGILLMTVLPYLAPSYAEATAISGVESCKPSGSEMFDLQGRKVTGRPAHGVYIINGKKSVIR